MDSISINFACETKLQQKLQMTTAMQQAVYVMQLPILELSDWLQSEVEKNPVLELKPSCNVKTRPADEEMSACQMVSQETLFNHLMAQAQCHFADKEKLKIAEWIIGHLDERGFLEIPLSELTSVAPLKELEAVLKELQTFDPPGVAAENVRASLLIQLKIKEKEKSRAYEIVEQHFDLLLHNRLDLIGKQMQLSVEKVASIIALEIAPLNLHPAEHFRVHHVQGIVPDLILTCIGESWKVEVNDAPLPRFSIASSYERAIQAGSLNAQERTYLHKHLHTGKWLRQIVQKRKKTLLALGHFLLKRQALFFQEGKLLPLVLSQAAEELELHESTVARAVGGKYLSCPQGIFALKDFFSQKVKAQGGSVSQHTMRRKLEQIIALENKQKPYSDADLQKELNSAGIFCARRTVTKYRRLLRVASRSRRKRWVANQ